MSATRLVLGTLLIVSVVSFGYGVRAQAATSTSYIVLPDSPWYILKIIEEKFRLGLAYVTGGTMREYVRIADNRLAEYKQLLESRRGDLAEKALRMYEQAKREAEARIAASAAGRSQDLWDIIRKIALSGWAALQDLIRVAGQAIAPLFRK